ncbi:hypothetical protein pb186bvf_019683 [Paramecium bursaria]
MQYLIQSFVIGFRSDDSQQMIEWDQFFDHNNQNIFIGTLDCEIYFLSCNEETPFIEQRTGHGKIRHVGIFNFEQLQEFLIQDHDHGEDEVEEIIEIVVYQPENTYNNDWVQDDNEQQNQNEHGHDHEHIEQHSEIQEKSQAEYLLELQQITSYVRDNYNRFKLEVSHISNSINNIDVLMKSLSSDDDNDKSDIYLYLTIIFMLVYLIVLRVWFKRNLRKENQNVILQ